MWMYKDIQSKITKFNNKISKTKDEDELNSLKSRKARLFKFRNTQLKTFTEILQNLGISQDEMNRPITDSENDPVLGLCNPYSKVTCLILYLYSMELYSPPLYSVANRVARDMDLAFI